MLWYNCLFILMTFLQWTTVNSNRVYNIGLQPWKLVNSNQSILLDAQVPGGVYTEIAHDQQVYLFYEYNDANFRWIGYENWTYFTDFELKQSDLSYKSIYLIFHGVDTISNVYVNGKLVGSTSNMFLRYKFPLKEFVQVGINNLYVNFTSPVLEAKRIASKLPYSIPSECWPNSYHGECHINKLRKMQASFAWDWGPAFPSVGLWKPVEIELSQGTVLRDIGIFLTTEEEDFWRITIRAWFEIENNVNGMLSAKLIVSDQIVIENHAEILVETSSKEGRIVLHVAKSQVDIWWPNGYGAQNLYNLLVTFKTDFETTSKQIEIGFRTVEVVQQPVSENASFGRSFFFRVNGVPIFAKGSNWIPSDVLPENSANEERVNRLLEAAVEANYNMLRVWGGGLYESELFYRLCDKYGIMIWHDLMFACNMYPAVDEYLETIKIEIKQQLKRLQHHSCIAVWAGNNENEVALKQNWYNTANNYSLYKNDYIKLYIDTIEPIIKSLDPQRAYFASSPSNGIQTIKQGYIADNPQSNLYGDVHYYNYIGNLWDSRVFPKPRFASEYGVQSIPAMTTLLNAINITNAVWGSPVLKWRQHSPMYYVPILLQIQINLPSSTQLENIIYLSQINQAMSIKTETEHYRRMKSVLLPTGEGLTMGALYWQLNDVWEAPSWSSIDYLGKWKMLHYFAKSFFANVIVSPVLESGDILSIMIISDLLVSVDKAQLFIDVYNWTNFIPVSSQRHYINLGPNQSKEILRGNLSYFMGTCTNKSDCFLVFSVILQGDLELMSVPQNYIFPTKLKSANFQWANVKVDKFVLQNRFEGLLILSTDEIALFVWIECLGARGESGIQFSENGFHMVQTHKIIQVTSKFPMDQASFISRLRITNLKPKYK